MRPSCSVDHIGPWCPPFLRFRGPRWDPSLPVGEAACRASPIKRAPAASPPLHQLVEMAAAVVFLLASLALALQAGAAAGAPQLGGLQLISASCRATEYPELCVRSLSAFAGTIKTPAQLTDAALSVSLRAARHATAMVARMAARRRHGMGRRAASAIGDCLETMADTVGELQDSLRVIGHLNRRNARMQMSNLQTWVSAALTDEDTCMEELVGKPVSTDLRTAARRRIKYVALLTRNALALINALSGMPSP